jgi:predicted permease
MDAHRDARAFGWLDAARRDLRYALQRFGRRPALAATAVLTLAAGIGLSTSVFSVVDALLLHPLPWFEPAGLVRVYGIEPPERRTGLTWNHRPVRGDGWHALRQSGAFRDVAVFFEPSPFILGERPTQARGLLVSSNFLAVLGIHIQRGRGFTAEDDIAATSVAIITHEAWQSRLGGRPDVIGLRLPLGQSMFVGGYQETRTIVGVLEPDTGALGLFLEGRGLPTGFRPREPVELLLPLERSVGFRFTTAYSVVARLLPGHSVAQTEEAAASALMQAENRAARLEPLSANLTRTFAPPLVLLFGGAGLLLLIASSNVAGLLLSEARNRQYEMGLRLTLGATRLDLLRQLTVEHLVLAGGAALAGVLAAQWLTPAIVALTAGRVPLMDTVVISHRVLGFALLTTVVTALLFGALPAWLMAGRHLSASLAMGARTSTYRGGQWHRAVVASEIAVAIVLLVAAGLFAETLLTLTGQPLHFNPSHLVAISTHFSPSARDSPPVAAIIDRLRAVPGVAAVAASSAVPFVGYLGISAPYRGPSGIAMVHRTTVTSNYLETVGLPILRGRGLTQADAAPATVVVISEGLDREFFGGEGLHRQLMPENGPPLEVVGVVPDSKVLHPSDDEHLRMYVVAAPLSPYTHFVVRTRTEPTPLLPLLREAVTAASEATIVVEASTMEAILARAFAGDRIRAALATVFASTALGLVAVGVYGLVSRLVAERRKDIGVRMALGAQPRDIQRLVLRESLIAITLGLAVGIPSTLFVRSAIEAFLFGVSSTAPHTYALSTATLLVVGLVATWLPAYRAGRLDPSRVLRES